MVAAIVTVHYGDARAVNSRSFHSIVVTDCLYVRILDFVCACHLVSPSCLLVRGSFVFVCSFLHAM